MNRIPRLRSVRTAGVVAALSLLASVIVLPAVPAGAATAPKKPTVVSLTFDDSNADQLAPVLAMNALGLHGTMFTTTGWIGQPGYLTQGNLGRSMRTVMKSADTLSATPT